MNSKEITLTIGFSALIIGFIFAVALTAVVIVNGMASHTNYVEEFQNCQTSSSGQEMCK